MNPIHLVRFQSSYSVFFCGRLLPMHVSNSVDRELNVYSRVVLYAHYGQDITDRSIILDMPKPGYRLSTITGQNAFIDDLYRVLKGDYVSELIRSRRIRLTFDMLLNYGEVATND